MVKTPHEQHPSGAVAPDDLPAARQISRIERRLTRVEGKGDRGSLLERVREKTPSLPHLPIPRALRPHLPRTAIDRAERDSDYKPAISSGMLAGLGALSVSAASLVPSLLPFRSYDKWAGEPVWDLGADRGEIVAAEDGTPLAVREIGPENAELTVIFVHGFTLSMDSFHFQATALKKLYGPSIRMVFYDLRGHGLSGRAKSVTYTIPQLAHDLRHIIDTLARDRPVVLVGHSMGGMTILKFAQLYPEFLAERIAGVSLLATAAGNVADAGLAALVDNPVVTSVAWSVERAPGIFHSGRRALGLVIEPLLKAGSFGTPSMVGKTLVDLTNDMIGSADVEVMAGFLNTLVTHDAVASYGALQDTTLSIVCGDADLLTPVNRSVELSKGLPNARFVVVPGCGHMVQLEAMDIANDEIAWVIDNAFESIGIEREPMSSVWDGIDETSEAGEERNRRP